MKEFSNNAVVHLGVRRTPMQASTSNVSPLEAEWKCDDDDDGANGGMA